MLYVVYLVCRGIVSVSNGTADNADRVRVEGWNRGRVEPRHRATHRVGEVGDEVVPVLGLLETGKGHLGAYGCKRDANVGADRGFCVVRSQEVVADRARR